MQSRNGLQREKIFCVSNPICEHFGSQHGESGQNKWLKKQPGLADHTKPTTVEIHNSTVADYKKPQNPFWQKTR